MSMHGVHTRILSTFILAALLVAPFRSEAGAITGKVTFKGNPRPPRTLQMSADPVCQALHGGSDAKDDKFTVGPAEGEGDVYPLADCFVYVKSGLPKTDYPAPSESVIVDQEGCRYIPHVTGAQVGQTVEFKNSDKTMHNVHSLSSESPSFNRGMPAGSPNAKYTLTAPEIMAKMKCDAHPWMSCYIGVVEHPFYTVTGLDGVIEIDGLEDGTYEVEVWQELLGTQTASVTVSGGSGAVDFQYAKPGK